MAKRPSTPTRFFLYYILCAAGVCGFLGFWGWVFKPGLVREPIQFSPEAVAAVKALRDLSLDPDGGPVIRQDVDYTVGKSASWFPRGESPILAELVAEGRLPPVEERVGPEPVVLEGVEGSGRYGGTWFRAATAASDIAPSNIRVFNAHLVRWSPQGYPLVPHVVKGWEVSEDGRVWTFHLRKGIRWSDGHPFTAEDILYWWEMEVKALELGWALWMNIAREPVEVEKVDDYTVRYLFPVPHGLFLEHMAMQGVYYAPKHYLAQYHPEFGDDALIEATMRSRRVATRRGLYSLLKGWSNPEHPRLSPWIYRTYTPNPPFTFVRNPYYFAVDTEGNQLPYIDRVFYDIKKLELIGIAAASGSISMQTRHIRFEDYTLLMSQREAHDYEVYHWFSAVRSDWVLFPNLNRRVDPEDPASRFKWELLNDRRFRQALSLAINRRQIIDAVFNGEGEPAQMSPGRESFFHHEGLHKAYTEHDPIRANRLLDEIGLRRRDPEGFRTFPDGSRMVWYIELTDFNGRGPAQFIIDDWAEVGIRAVLRVRSRTLWIAEKVALSQDFSVYLGQGEYHPLVEPRNFAPGFNALLHFAYGFGRWFANGGLWGSPDVERVGGIKPPAGHPLYESRKAFEEAIRAPTLERQREAFSQALEIAAENLWTISIATPPPRLAVVKNGFRNVPKTMVYGGRYRTPGNAASETFYFDNAEASPVAVARIKAEMVEITPAPNAVDTETLMPERSGGLGRLIRRTFIAIGTCLLILVGCKHPYVGRRLLLMVPTMLIISAVAFTIIQLPPGNFIETRIKILEMEGNESAIEELEQLRGLFHLDEPPVLRYLRWLGLFWFFGFDEKDLGLLQGHMGFSMENQRPVNDVVGDRILLTFLISLGTILFTWATALPIGIYSAVRQYSIGDYVLTFIGFIGMCVPNFLLALLLIYWSGRYFGMDMTGLFSTDYAARPEWTWGKVIDLLKHIWLPVVVLGTGGTAGMIRVMRGNLLDELKKPYVLTAMAKGVRPFKLLLKFPVRLALNPFISGIGSLFPQLVSGGAIVAMVLSLPTVGPLMLSALMSEDMYLAGSMLMVLSLLGVLGTLVSDLLLLWLDPRIRLEGGSR